MRHLHKVRNKNRNCRYPTQPRQDNGQSDKLMPADKDNERWYLNQKVGGVYGQIVDNPHIDEKGAPVCQ